MSEDSFLGQADGRYAIRGQLTFQTVPRFFEHTREMLGTGHGPVTVDLAGVTLADSAGIALLVEWQQQARAANRALAFANLPEQVRKVIRVSGLQQAFDIR
jgi:phospholipid transport system transporter-binding protein